MLLTNEYILNWLALATLQKELFGISFVPQALWKKSWGTKDIMSWENLEAPSVDWMESGGLNVDYTWQIQFLLWR